MLIAYAAGGAITAFAFAIYGASRLVPGAQLSLGARLLLIPGALMLWPLIVKRWLVRGGGPAESDTTSTDRHP